MQMIRDGLCRPFLHSTAFVPRRFAISVQEQESKRRESGLSASRLAAAVVAAATAAVVGCVSTAAIAVTAAAE